MMFLPMHHLLPHSYILMLHMAIQLELSFPSSLAASGGHVASFQVNTSGIGVGNSVSFI